MATPVSNFTLPEDLYFFFPPIQRQSSEIINVEMTEASQGAAAVRDPMDDLVSAIAGTKLKNSPRTAGPIRKEQVVCDFKDCGVRLNGLQKRVKCACDGCFCGTHFAKTKHRCKAAEHK